MVSILNAERPIHIIANGLGETIKQNLTTQSRAVALHDPAQQALETVVSDLVAQPDTQIVFFVPSPDAAHDQQEIAELQATIRSQRKDLYLILASETESASPEEQYFKALELMKCNHANLVLARDSITGQSMVVVPEEAYYGRSDTLDETVGWLTKIALARAGETFTRSQVVEGDAVPWNSQLLSASFREVVDQLVAKGAYKPLFGKTAGHFAVRGPKPGEFLTSRRGQDFNKLNEIGLVRVEAKGRDEVIAHGSKPSVGGQSQRIIFEENPSLSNIVHFHSPLRDDARDVPVRAQWPFECGSHQCGQNTANGLREVATGIHAVMLENHGPNIVFGNDVSAGRVLDFIERNFDLDAKTGYAPVRPDQKARALETAPATAC